MDSKVIYKATNLIDGKVYIGQTNNLERRIREHRGHAVKDGGPFHEAVRKYGLHNFKFDIIEECRSDLADERERFFIAKYRADLGADLVYNYCDGGLGGQTHDVSGENNPSYGRVFTLEERESRSKKLKGRKKPEGFGEKVSKRMKGRPKSREQVLKKSHPISVVQVSTGEIIHFSSKSEMERTLHCSTSTIMEGRTTQNGYKLHECKIGTA